MQSFPALIRNMSFKRKLIMFSLLLSIVPVLIVGLSSSYLTSRSMQAEVNANHSAALSQIQFQMNNLIKTLHITSIRLATNLSLEKSVLLGPTMDNLNQTLEMSEAIRREMSLSTIKLNVSLVYLKQHYIYSTAIDNNKLTESQVQEMLERGKPLYNSSFMVLPDPNRSREDLLLFRPVPLSTSYSDGILVLHLNVHELIKFLTSLSEGLATKIFIVDSNNSIIASKDPKDIGTRLNMYPMGTLPNADPVPRHYELEGKDYTVSAQSSLFADWTYIIVTPTKALTERSDSIRAITWSMVGALAAFWIAVALFGSYRLYVPIARMLHKSFTGNSLGLGTGKGSASRPADGLKALDSFIENMVSTNRELKKELHEQSPYLQQSIIQQLLLGEMSESQSADKIDRFHLPIKGTLFCVAVVAVDQYNSFIGKYKEKDRTLIHYALRKMIEEQFDDELSCFTTVSQPGLLAVLIGADVSNPTAVNRLPHQLDDIRGHILQYFQFSVSVACSPFRHGYTNIHECYQEALGLLRQRLTLGHNVTITHGNLGSETNQAAPHYSELQKTIVSHVRNGNLEEAKGKLAELFSELPDQIRSVDAAIGAFAYLLGELDSMLHRFGCKLDSALGADAYKELYGKSTIQEVRDWLSDVVFPSVKQRMDQLSVTKQAKLIHQVLQYLDEHLEHDLSLQQLADHFQLSTSHLSRMFKEETNRTFSEYVLEQRMNKAREWLAHTSMPIKAIADQLRYTNVTNFTRAYKQFFGTSPGKFRNQALSD